MQSLDDIYGMQFFRKRKPTSSWAVDAVCSAVMEVLSPVSVVDVGCGLGELVAGFASRGVAVVGVEGSAAVIPYLRCDLQDVLIHDLREPWPAWQGFIGPRFAVARFDVALSFEVAEHIEGDYADEFVKTLTTLSPWVVMSAAPPRQKGYHHVNCQQKSYWEEKFSARGYVREKDVEQAIRKQWEPWKDVKGLDSYYRNLMCFRESNA